MTIIKAKLAHLQQRCQQRGYNLDEVLPCIARREGDHIWVDVEHEAYPHPRPPAKWPLWAKAVWLLSRRSDQGVGDTIHRLLAAMGVRERPGCGCGSKRVRLNRVYPYRLRQVEQVLAPGP